MVVLGLSHFIAEKFYLYWTLWWFDNYMHFLGGFVVGLASVWLVFDSGLFIRREPRVSEAVLAALIFVVVIGVAWEVFEYVGGIAGFEHNYVEDTISDIVFDILGATTAALIGVKKIFRIREKTSSI